MYFILSSAENGVPSKSYGAISAENGGIKFIASLYNIRTLQVSNVTWYTLSKILYVFSNLYKKQNYEQKTCSFWSSGSAPNSRNINLKHIKKKKYGAELFNFRRRRRRQKGNIKLVQSLLTELNQYWIFCVSFLTY